MHTPDMYFFFFLKFKQIIDIGELLTKEDANERKKCVLTKNRFFPLNVHNFFNCIKKREDGCSDFAMPMT